MKQLCFRILFRHVSARLDMQGTSKETVQEDKTVLAPQKAVAAAFVLPKYSKNFAQTKSGPPLEYLLAPSFISKDTMRITRFEPLVMGLLDRLDDPLNRSIDFSVLKEAVRSFSGFVRYGYDVHIVIYCHGIDSPGMEELKTYASGVIFHIWDRPFEELLGNISLIDIVSCAGAGFFRCSEQQIRNFGRSIFTGWQAPAGKHCLGLSHPPSGGGINGGGVIFLADRDGVPHRF